MAELSAEAFENAVNAPTMSSAVEAVASGVKSLGDLFGAAKRSSSPSSNQNVNATLNADEVRLAKRLMELDDAWRANKLWTGPIYEPLISLLLPKNSSPRPMCTPHEIRNQNQIFVDSVFDRLAKRAQWSKRTDDLLGRLTAEDPTTKLLNTLVLLRAERGQEANARLSEFGVSDLKGVQNEVALQVLPLAMKHDECRESAIQLVLALVDQKPTHHALSIDYALRSTRTQRGEDLLRERSGPRHDGSSHQRLSSTLAIMTTIDTAVSIHN